MRHGGTIVTALAIGLVGFLAGRAARGSLGTRGNADLGGPQVMSDRAHPGEPAPEGRGFDGGGAVPRVTAPLPAAVPPTSATDLALMANITEPAAVTAGRRKIVRAELAQKAPDLAPETQDLIVRESDRLALNKRKLRDAFLHEQISEADYVAALKNDIRTAMTVYESLLTDSEFEALTHRVRGSGIDPFSMESLARAAPSNKAAERPVASASVPAREK